MLICILAWDGKKRQDEKEITMSERIYENNQLELVGEVSKEAVFSHEVYGEGFYLIEVKASRTSGFTDEIPVMVSERMCNVNELYIGQRLRVTGQFRSFNRHDEKKNRLILSVFARELELLDDMQSNLEENSIVLDGYICKEPIYRKTPLGREIADLLIAVNRSYGKTDYIPCICWGRNARFAGGLDVGSHVWIHGRIQSREYLKKLSDAESEKRVAYEVSVSKVEVVDEY